METKEKLRVALENFLYLLLLRLTLFLFFFAFKHPLTLILSGFPLASPVLYYSLAGLVHWYIGGRIGKARFNQTTLIVFVVHVPYFIIAGFAGTIWPFNFIEYLVTACVLLAVAMVSSHRSITR